MLEERKYTHGILLDAGNAEEVAKFEDMSLGAAANLIARELKYADRAGHEIFIIFGVDSDEAPEMSDAWVRLTQEQLDANFEYDRTKITSEVVKLYYK